MKLIRAKNGKKGRLALWLTLVICTFCACSVVSLSPAFADDVPLPDTNNNDGNDATDTNPGTAWDIRQNYFKRFPYAQDAYNNDVLEPVDDGNTTPDGIHPVDRMQRSAPGVPNFVMAYNFVVNYGYYYQWPCPALDTPATMRDNELFDNQLTTFGMPVSDTQFQIIDRENKQRFLELMFDPERIMWTLQNMGVGSSAANSAAGVAESSFDTAVNRITQADGAGAGGDAGPGIFGGGGGGLGALINIANENSGVYTASDNPDKSIPQAVWMVQQMYKFVFVPMAILFLLPGAVATQVKGQVAFAFKINQDDNSSPFEGILRAMIAVFLIPATQLIVSYAIDVGNSMAYSVGDFVQAEVIEEWSHKLTYNNAPANVNNAILPLNANTNGTGTNGSAATTNGGFLSGLLGQAAGGLGLSQTTMSQAMGVIGQLPGLGALFGDLQGFLGNVFGAGGGGLGDQQEETTAINEQELWLSQILQLIFNVANYLFSLAVVVLTAFQLVFMCYLYLLGPLAAALFAWPKTSQNLFRDIWGNWVNAVIVVSLWRFYWMVILAIMTQRILYMLDNNTPLNLQWEVAVYTCFMGLMLYVPFNPWSFDPSVAFDIMASGQAIMQQAGGAMGSALQAAGVPQSTINQMAAPFNAVYGQNSPMNQFINSNQTATAYASGNYTQNFDSKLQGGGSPSGAQGQTQGQTSPSVQLPPQTAPQQQQVAPQTQLPPQQTATPGQAGPAQSPPPQNNPTGTNNGAANQNAVQNAAPTGTQVNEPGNPKEPSGPTNPSVTPNPNVTPGEATRGIQALQQSHDVGKSEPPAAGQAQPAATPAAPPAPTPPPAPATPPSPNPPPPPPTAV